MFIKPSESAIELIKKIEFFAKCYPSVTETMANSRTQVISVKVAGFTVVFMVEKVNNLASYTFYDKNSQPGLSDTWRVENKVEERYAFETIIETLKAFEITI